MTVSVYGSLTFSIGLAVLRERLADRDHERAVDRAAVQHLAFADLRLVGGRAVQAVAVGDRRG